MEPPEPAPRLKRVIGVFGLTMMNVASVASIRNLSLGAEYGVASALWYVLSGVLFCLPIALVAAELGSAMPHTGGVYLWVRAGLGPRMGMLAAWMQWLQNVVWYPAVLSFIVSVLAYLIDPALAHNPFYLIVSVLSVLWVVTWLSTRGVEATTTLSAVGVLAGTFVPIFLLAGMSIYWLATGHPSAASLAPRAWLPQISDWRQLPLLAGVITGLGGLEMPAVHAGQIMRPQRTFPIASLVSVAMILGLYILGTLALVLLIPLQEMDLLTAVGEAFARFGQELHLGWFLPASLLLILLGAFSNAANWAIGPCRALFATGRDGDLPPGLCRLNRHGVPARLLILQGVCVSALTLVFALLPRVQDSYWLLLGLSAQLYLVLYLMLFSAAWRLRRNGMAADFQVPGGHLGMHLACTLGWLTSFFGFFIAFIPLPGMSEADALRSQIFLLIGLSGAIGAPLLLYQFKRAEWKPKDLALFD